MYTLLSVLYKIKRILKKTVKLYPSDKILVIFTIKEFLEAHKFPFTAIDVKSHLKINLNI